MLPARVLIVIVNYRTPELALGVLKSLAPEVTARGDTHVVVIDNGSDDGSAKTIADGIAARDFGYWSTAVAMPDNRGFSAGNNAGVAWYREKVGALPDFVWLLNPDTRAWPDAIGALVRFLDTHPEAGIAGGHALWEDGRVWTGGFRFLSPCSEFVDALEFGLLRRMARSCAVVMPAAERPMQTDWVSGASMMIRRQVIEKIGPMDEGYFLYFEETDYCAQAAAAGFACWIVPDSRVTHIGGQATGITGGTKSEKRRPRYWFASRARFMRRHHGTAKTHLANLLWLIGTPIGRGVVATRGGDTRPPHLWRDFLVANYGPDGVMYRPGPAKLSRRRAGSR